MSEIRYEQTGEYRPPKKGEWYLGVFYQVPIQVGDERPKKKRRILRRVETDKPPESEG